MTFASWLRGLVRGTERTQRSSRRPASGSRRSALRLAVEVLEDRVVPSATVSFSAQVFASGGFIPQSVAVGDFNNDGKADLAVANVGSDNVGVFLGNSTGGLTPAGTFGTGGSTPVSVAAGDFNGDGHADLAVANLNSQDVGVLLGDGLGGFATAAVSSNHTDTLNPPFSIAVGDFNNDGHADVATTIPASNTVSVLLGNGSGAFSSPVLFASGGAGARSIAVGDFNGDGNPDLAVGHNVSANVGVLLGNGDGSFAPAVAFASGAPNTLGVAVGDFNKDGKADLAVVNNSGSNTVGVLLGDGHGSFASASTFLTGGIVSSAVAVGDFNNDGNSDLAVALGGSNSAAVLQGDGLGGFAPAVTFASGGGNPVSVAVGDLNGDGRADIAVANINFNKVGVLLNTTVTNQPPVANDDSASLTEDNASVGGNVLTNDTDVDSATLMVVNPGSFSGTYGALTLNSDGSYSYVLNTAGVQHLAQGASVVDSFSYQASDGLSSSNTAIFTVTITGVNDAPVNTMPGDQVAAEDVAKVIGGLSVADVDDATGILTVTLAVGHGTLTVNGSVASGAGISGNGTATVTLNGTQAQINATLGAGLTYLGGLNYSGLDALTMTTIDAGGLSDIDAVAIDVLSAQQQAEVLAAIITDLADDGVLAGGQDNALIKKLGFVSRPNGGAVALQAFVNQVNGLANAGVLTRTQADELIASAQSIIASMQ